MTLRACRLAGWFLLCLAPLATPPARAVMLAEMGEGVDGWSGATWDPAAGHIASGCAELEAPQSVATFALGGGADWLMFREFRFAYLIAPTLEPVVLSVELDADDIGSPMADVYVSSVMLSAGDWQTVRLPQWDFEPRGTPVWANVRAVRFRLEWGMAGAIGRLPNARLDDLELDMANALLADTVVLGDMEQDVGRWHGLEPTAEVSRSGRWAGKWPDAVDTPWVYSSRVPADWTPYRTLCLSAFSISGPRALRVRIYTGDPATDYSSYRYDTWLDGDKWEDVQIPLWAFGSDGDPRPWGSVHTVTIILGPPELPAVPGGVLLDDIFLSAEAPDSVDLLADDVSGWPQLRPSRTNPAEGEVCGEWGSPIKTPWIETRAIPQDWSPYGELAFWLHSATANGQEVRVRAYTGDPATEYASFWTPVVLDWQGWKQVALPLGLFARDLDPSGWDHITCLTICAGGEEVEARPDTYLMVDDIRLVRSPVAEEIILLDEDDIAGWRGLELSEEYAFAGHVSGRWPDTRDMEGVRCTRLPEDWSRFSELDLSIYNEPGSRSYFQVYLRSDDPSTEVVDGFRHVVSVDWDGWGRVRLTPTHFSRTGRPVGWDRIDDILLNVGAQWEEKLLPATTLYLDRVVLRLDRIDADQDTPLLQGNALGYGDFARGQPPGIANEPPPELYVLALLPDGAGGVLVGTDEGGLLRLSATGALQQLGAVEEGLGDRFARALAWARNGTAAVGRMRTGVALVDLASGRADRIGIDAVGAHVNDIETARSGALWIASERGIAVLDPDGALVATFDARSGLPGDAVLDVALGPNRTAWAVPTVGGLYRLGPIGLWEPVSWTDGPSRLNCVVITDDGRVFAGGPEGLVSASEEGGSPEAIALFGIGDAAGERPFSYVTSLLIADGYLYIGTRHLGVCRMALELSGGESAVQALAAGPRDTETYVTSMARSGDRLFVGTYGDGLYVADGLPQWADPPPRDGPDVGGGLPPAEISRESLLSLFPESDSAWLKYIGEDWTTLGDWVGVYGNFFAQLCAMPWKDQQVTNEGTRVITNRNPRSSRLRGFVGPYRFLGPNVVPNDRPRSWLDPWTHPEDRRVLIDPLTPNAQSRSQGCWDDHGEAYALSHEGPDLYISMTLPAGLRKPDRYRISFYFFAPSHQNDDRYRDHVIEAIALDQPIGPEGYYAAIHTAKPVATARVVGLRGGVYHQFLVTGGHTYAFRIRRGGSLNTTLSAYFIDNLDDDYVLTREDVVAGCVPGGAGRVRCGSY